MKRKQRAYGSTKPERKQASMGRMMYGKGGYKLMKHTGKFVKHKGATLEANFPIQKVHKK